LQRKTIEFGEKLSISWIQPNFSIFLIAKIQSMLGEKIKKFEAAAESGFGVVQIFTDPPDEKKNRSDFPNFELTKFFDPQIGKKKLFLRIFLHFYYQKHLRKFFTKIPINFQLRFLNEIYSISRRPEKK